MAWRTVVVSNPAKLRVENSQLVITQDHAVPLPLSDINVLLLESPDISLTAALLYRLAQHGVHLIVCDEKHMPCMSGLPFEANSRVSGAQRLQLSASLPFKKRCWQALVRQKIRNQAFCVEFAGLGSGAGLRNIAEKTLSGDSRNSEAVAARRYFNILFGPKFIRGADDGINAALNYGYSIMRAVVARALSSHGFLLTQGIHHRSELNAFNLADDFIEPFRPVVDLYTARHVKIDDALSPERRKNLTCLVGAAVEIDGKRHGVNNAMEIAAASFVTACRSGNAADLKVPILLDVGNHSYE